MAELDKEIVQELNKMCQEQKVANAGIEAYKKNFAEELKSVSPTNFNMRQLNQPLLCSRKKLSFKEKRRRFWNRIKVTLGWI